MGVDATPVVSVVIPTLERPQELNACLASLKVQAFQNIQIILLRQRGPLAFLRNQGLHRARAPVVCFIDDDVICAPTWLLNLLRTFQRFPNIVGVTGPAIIPDAFRNNRDLYRYKQLRWLYDKLFVDTILPGHLTKAGTFPPEPNYHYFGSVQFLEACNMSFRTEALKRVGGFDEQYRGIGDWSEPDVCFRLRQCYGDTCLQFNPGITLEHRPSCRGAYLFRESNARQRLANYQLFTKRWVRPMWRNWLYQRFLEGYYTWQQFKSLTH